MAIMSSLERTSTSTHDLINDTQDSQAYLETIKTELGFNGSSRFGQDETQGDETRKDASSNDILPATVENSQLDDTRVPEATSRLQILDPKQISTHTEAAESMLPQPPIATYVEVPNSIEAESGAEGKAARPEPIREVSPGRTAREQDASGYLKSEWDLSEGRADRKMDASQQSPTQVNEDRNYEVDGEAYNSLPSTLSRGYPQDADVGDRTLLPDDTGAVNFENIHDLPRPSSQVSEDGGFENTRGDWRNPDRTSQHLSSIYTPFKSRKAAFETPALPKNPFAAGKDIAVPLGGTQLFGQTQFSSAIKQASPGSSRPSPNVPLSNLSPNIAETSPLKNRANVSSPTDIHTSSPQRPDEVPTTVLRHNSLGRIEEETPTATRSTGEEVVPESPTNKAPKSSGSRQPLAHYETMKKSQERKYQDESVYHIVTSDSESDSAVKGMERRKRLEQKRAQAAKEMERISFTPKPRRNSGDRPRVKRQKTDGPPHTVNTPSLIMHALIPSRSEESTEPLVEDSQQRSLPLPQLETGIPTQLDGGKTEAQLNKVEIWNDSVPPPTQHEPEEITEERILATSPIGADATQRWSNPELPCLDTTASRILDSSNETGERSSLPPLNRKPTATYYAKSRQQRRRTVLSSSATEAPTPPQSAAVAPSSPPPEPDNPTLEMKLLSKRSDNRAKEVQQAEISTPCGTTRQTPIVSTSLRATRSRAKTTSPLTPLTNQASEGLVATSSTGELSSAPPSSAITTPGTKGEMMSVRTESVVDTSPVTGDGLGKQALQADEIRASPHLPARSLRASRRAIRYDSESTDELCPSSCVGAPEQSVLNPKRSYGQFRHSIGQTQRSSKLFGGMAFALSFQSNVKPQDRDKLKNKIVQAGGLVLEDFEGLFEPSAVMDTTSPVFDAPEPLRLKTTFSEIGFTALIADSHSRKAKYMQALALGLPCIACQWVDACLESGCVVEWEHYLLCSGTSALLGNAIKSRILPPYPASESCLADVMNNRQQLLHGQRILAVVDSKKRQSDAKRPYIFLAQALGPSISRVFTTKQASEALSKNSKAGKPFDWLYFDQGKDAAKAVLSGATNVNVKKRKRASASAALPKLEDIRVLNDELIIQTLILGRVVREHEMSSLGDS